MYRAFGKHLQNSLNFRQSVIENDHNSVRTVRRFRLLLTCLSRQIVAKFDKFNKDQYIKNSLSHFENKAVMITDKMWTSTNEFHINNSTNLL